MKISKNSYVSLSYRLTVDGNVVEDVKADAPLDFIFGAGMLLPQFESNVDGKSVGDAFAFTLTPTDAYGEFIADAVVELPKSIFEIEGKFNSEVVFVDAVLPMMDNEGNQMYGKVEAVTEDNVKMNFNHPMAGKTLSFEGEVVGVREATDADMAKFMPQGGGGCSCGCNNDDCECEDGDCGCEGGDCGCEGGECKDSGSGDGCCK